MKAAIPLSAEAMAEALTRLPGWQWEKEALVKTFRFKNFREAMGFMLRVSYAAEAMDHHPEWRNVYDRVEVRLCTHAAGGRVTVKDVALAEAIEAG